jgi:transposase-like protein
LGANLQVVSREVHVAIGINALGYREVLGIAGATARPKASGNSYWTRWKSVLLIQQTCTNDKRQPRKIADLENSSSRRTSQGNESQLQAPLKP